jgi:endonuclease YncB( thermonuclease family)
MRENGRGLAGALVAVVLVGFVVVVIALLVACTGPLAADSSTVTASEVPLTARDDGLYVDGPERLLLARVDRVIDGDTLDVIINGETSRVRLFGVDAAERGASCYEEATEALRALAGTQVRLLADERREDGFGRWLRYAFTPDGRSIDAALVASGHATAWRDDGAYRDVLVGIEDEAQAGREGCLWQ